MQEIETDRAPPSIGPFSQAVRDGDTVYVSGQGPVDPDTGDVITGDIRAETERTLRNIRALLDAAGGGLDDVVKTTVFVADMADYDAINQVYAEHFSAPYPARSAVEVVDHPVAIGVEIEAIASL